MKTCETVLAKRRVFLYAVRSRWMWGPRCLLFRSSRPILPSLPSFLLSFFIYFSSPIPSLTPSSWFSLLSPSRKWLESKPRLFLICGVIQNKLCPRPLFTVRVATNYNSCRLVSAPTVFNNCAICLFSWRYNPYGCIFHSPVAGFSLLILEVSWSHTTTRHSR